jgi:hypothetical protein
MITSYVLHGDFLESCDCFELCPCWVDDNPDEDHCTGIVAWRLGEGCTIGTAEGLTDVSGAIVAAVTGHSGGRRDASALTVLFVDDSRCKDRHLALLADAFSGTDDAAKEGDPRTPIDGPLGALAKVTGTVLGAARRADITFPAGAKSWTLTVTPCGKDDAPGTGSAVHAEGEPRSFPDDPLLSGAAADAAEKRTPLRLTGTALHAELQIQNEARAQRTTTLSVRVPALPGGYVEVRTRSGMRGTFSYSHPKTPVEGSRSGSAKSVLRGTHRAGRGWLRRGAV